MVPPDPQVFRGNLLGTCSLSPSDREFVLQIELETGAKVLCLLNFPKALELQLDLASSLAVFLDKEALYRDFAQFDQQDTRDETI